MTDAKSALEIRARAEAMSLQRLAALPEDEASLTPDRARTLVHELRVHQVELEMQNETLRDTQAALDAAHAELFDLYDRAPVGYLTLDSSGAIRRANLTAARLFGCSQAELVSRPLSAFIVSEDQDIYYLYRKRLRPGAPLQSCEIRMTAGAAAPFWVQMEAEAMGAEESPPVRLVLSDITERRRAAELLRHSLCEQTALLKEVHHRVKNNLQVVSSLLHLESARSSNAQTLETLRDMQARILSMALLHETLYRTGHFGRVDLSVYLGPLVAQLFRFHNRGASEVRLLLDLAPIEVALDQAIPCGLIVNELLTNSLKHGFAKGAGGELHVTLRRTLASIALEVSDSGLGLATDFEARRGHALGLNLVSDLARQLLGTLAIGPGPAARFTVTFPETIPADPA